MRVILLICLALLGTSAAHAQQQERKLLDRLLKPDMALQNKAQEKQFVAAGAKLEKQARTKQFYAPNWTLQKQFRGTWALRAGQFRTARSRYDRAEANLATRNRLPEAELAFSTPSYREVRAARDAEKTAESRAHSGTRPFLVRGKSQKSLSAQDRPLTIDQVRELLNKNK